MGILAETNNTEEYVELTEKCKFDDNKTLGKNSILESSKEFIKIVLASMTITLSYISTALLLSINIHFVGKLDSIDKVAGIGLGNVWINFIANHIIFGFDFGFECLVAKAFAVNNLRAIKYYFIKATLIIWIVLAFAFSISSQVDEILISLGQNPNVAMYVREYVIPMYPSFIFTAFYDLNVEYMNARGCFSQQMFIQIFTTPLHFLWAKFLVYDNQMGLLGVALAMDITQFLKWASIRICRWYKQKSDEPYSYKYKVGFTKGWKTYLKVSAPIAFVTVLEFFGMEIYSILAGLLNDSSYLAAHVAMANTWVLLYNIPEGFGTAMFTFLGKAIGERKVNKVRRFAFFGVLGCVLSMSLFVILIVILRNQWSDYFMENDSIHSIMLSMLPLFAPYLVLDALKSTLAGVLKAMGKQRRALITFCLCIYGVAIPCSILFGFVLDLKLFGIWLGGLVGQILTIFFLSLFIFRFDWEYLVDDQIEHNKSERASFADPGEMELEDALTA